MKIEKYERIFMIVVAAFLGLGIGALVLTITQEHATLPEPADRIAPELVRSTAPFDEPGVRQVGPDEYDVVIVAQAWSWTPGTNEPIVLPEGATANFKIASVDVIHGFKIPDTNANAMVIPGQVTEVEVTFDEPGTKSLLCHEYCGIGHHQMGAEIIVEPADGGAG